MLFFQLGINEMGIQKALLNWAREQPTAPSEGTHTLCLKQVIYCTMG